jgi:hypothetical protein
LPRASGTSAWTFRRKLRYLLDSVFAFTNIPITALVGIGVLGSLLTGVVGLVVLVARLSGDIQTPGYTPLMLVVLLSTFVLLTGIGIVGSYVWRTYENSKGRPSAVVMEPDLYTGDDPRPGPEESGA